MKHLTYILLLLLPYTAGAQNIVQNGDFEQYNSCPSNFSQIDSCTGWKNFVLITGVGYPYTSSDYFNTCANGIVKIPTTNLGYQQPKSGNAYTGVLTYVKGYPYYREIITRNMFPMNIGEQYEISFFISLANDANISTNNIGLLLYDQTDSIYLPDLQYIQPQINFLSSGVFSDTTNWVRIIDTITADSSYDNVAIGGFYKDSVITIDTTNAYNAFQSYYYIDSLTIKPLRTIYIESISDSILCINDSFDVHISTNINHSSNNIFYVQLSGINGSFNNPINIGVKAFDSSCTIRASIPSYVSTSSNYRIRVLASSPNDSITSDRTFKIGNTSTSFTPFSSNSPVCINDTIKFTNNINEPAYTYNWHGPNNFSSSLAAPSIANASSSKSGNYYVECRLYGCMVRDTLLVQTNSNPTKPSALANAPLCEYDDLHLNTTSSTTGISYLWTGPNSFSSNVKSPSIANISQNATGLYIVTTSSSNGCSNSDTIYILVKDNPDTITVSSNSPVCTDDTLKLFSDTSTGNVLYTWSGPNSFTSSANDTQIVNAGIVHTGWYSMTVNLNGCTYTDSTYASVYQTPSAPTLSYNNPLCVGETLSLNANSLVSGVTYNWAGPGSFSSAAKSPVISNAQLSDTGNYTATVNYNGCISPVSTLPVTIKPTPFVVIYASPSDTICDGDNINILSIPANAGNNLSYAWRINAQLQTATGSTYASTAFKDKDVIVCMMTDSTSCSDPYTDTSNDVQVNVLPWLTPSVSIVANPPGLLKPWEYVQFTATPTNAGSSPLYQWKRNGQDIIGATSNIWSANNLNDNDTIHVELISSYNCPQPANAASNSIVVQIATGINEVAGFYNLTLSPNPNNGQFTLRGMVKQNGTATISVMNMVGQRIYHQQANINQQQLQHEVDLNHVASGLYLLRLEMNGAVTHVKFEMK